MTEVKATGCHANRDRSAFDPPRSATELMNLILPVTHIQIRRLPSQRSGTFRMVVNRLNLFANWFLQFADASDDALPSPQTSELKRSGSDSTIRIFSTSMA
jgi:hypothetical protein